MKRKKKQGTLTIFIFPCLIVEVDNGMIYEFYNVVKSLASELILTFFLYFYDYYYY